MKRMIFGLALALAALPGMAAAAPIPVFNVNEAFVANELSGTPANPNGPYKYGYTFDPTNPAATSTAGLSHTGPGGFNSSSPTLQGYFISNNIIVPAILGNTSTSPIGTNFGVPVVLGHQLLLHPGSPTADGYAIPPAAAVVQYTVPTAGTYNITGIYDALSSGNTGVNVYANGVQVFTAQSGVQGTMTPFSVTQTLAAGSTIAFVVDQGADNGIGSDSTGLFANIQAVATPEPTSMVLAAIGAVGFGVRRLRRAFA